MSGLSGRKKLLFLVGLILFIPIIFLVGLESILRLLYVPPISPGFLTHSKERRYALQPHFEGKTHNAQLLINSYGLRDKERPVSKRSDAYRIVVLGDSITFGHGVEMEETFPKMLEDMLNDSLEKPVQVFNLGVPSYNTIDEFNYLVESYDTFRPHLAIFQFTSVNDTKVPLLGERENSIVRWVKGHLRELYSYPWLARLVQRLVDRNRFAGDNGLTARVTYEELLYADEHEGWLEVQRTLGDIASFSKARDLPVLFAIFSNNISLSTDPKSDIMFPIIEKIKRALAAKGIHHSLVLDDAFREYSGSENKLWVRPDDAHFSPLAHKLAADAVFTYISSNGSMRTADR